MAEIPRKIRDSGTTTKGDSAMRKLLLGIAALAALCAFTVVTPARAQAPDPNLVAQDKGPDVKAVRNVKAVKKPKPSARRIVRRPPPPPPPPPYRTYAGPPGPYWGHPYWRRPYWAYRGPYYPYYYRPYYRPYVYAPFPFIGW
jgi:hypothetical protein